ATVHEWGERPVEDAAGDQVVVRAERLLEHLRLCGRYTKFRDALLKKRRPERDVLGPADWPIACGEILDGFTHVERSAAKGETAMDPKLCQGQERAHRDRRAGDVDVDVVAHE